MSCGHCSSSKNKDKEKIQYKCEICGNISNDPGACHDKPMVKMCDCGSGKYSKDCCEA